MLGKILFKNKINIVIYISFFVFFFASNIGLTNNIIKAEDTICPLTTNQDFKLGDIHEDIRQLQKYLNNNGYILATTGPGRIGGETNYFGYLTQSALTKFQQDKNIKSNNLGVLDLATRNYLNCNNNNEYENKLIKYTNNNKVYKVENNLKRWIVDRG
ncbi:MAG: peptidoglycan-binding domain-containing protein [Patescibacteria group bacterium]